MMSTGRPTSVNEEVMIAVMGMTGTGKSTFIRLLTDDPNIVIGHKTHSETSEINTSQYEDKDSGIAVTLVDTPGFDDSTGLSDVDVLEKIVTFLQENGGRKLNGLIYLHRIIDPRLGGLAQKNLRMFKSLCGDKLDNVRIVTTNWGAIDPAVGKEREADLVANGFKFLIEAGARLVRHDKGLDSAQIIMSQLIFNAAVKIRVQEQLDAGIFLSHTDAGIVVYEELDKLKKKQETKIARLRKQLEQATKVANKSLMSELHTEIKGEEERKAALEEKKKGLTRRPKVAWLSNLKNVSVGFGSGLASRARIIAGKVHPQPTKQYNNGKADDKSKSFSSEANSEVGRVESEQNGGSDDKSHPFPLHLENGAEGTKTQPDQEPTSQTIANTQAESQSRRTTEEEPKGIRNGADETNDNTQVPWPSQSTSKGNAQTPSPLPSPSPNYTAEEQPLPCQSGNSEPRPSADDISSTPSPNHENSSDEPSINIQRELHSSGHAPVSGPTHSTPPDPSNGVDVISPTCLLGNSNSAKKIKCNTQPEAQQQPRDTKESKLKRSNDDALHNHRNRADESHDSTESELQSEPKGTIGDTQNTSSPAYGNGADETSNHTQFELEQLGNTKKAEPKETSENIPNTLSPDNGNSAEVTSSNEQPSYTTELGPKRTAEDTLPTSPNRGNGVDETSSNVQFEPWLIPCPMESRPKEIAPPEPNRSFGASMNMYPESRPVATPESGSKGTTDDTSPNCSNGAEGQQSYDTTELDSQRTNDGGDTSASYKNGADDTTESEPKGVPHRSSADYSHVATEATSDTQLEELKLASDGILRTSSDDGNGAEAIDSIGNGADNNAQPQSQTIPHTMDSQTNEISNDTAQPSSLDKCHCAGEIDNNVQSEALRPSPPAETELKGTSNDTSSADEIKNNDMQSGPLQPSLSAETELKGTSNDTSSPDEISNDKQSVPQEPSPPAESELKGTSKDTSAPDEIKNNNVQSKPLQPSPPAETELKGTMNDTSSHDEIKSNNVQSEPLQPSLPAEIELNRTSNDPSSPDLSNFDEINNDMQSMPQEPFPPAESELKGTSNDSSSPDLSNSDEINNDMQSMPQEPSPPAETELKGTMNDTSSHDEIKNNNVQSEPLQPSLPAETELNRTSNDTSSPDEINNDKQSVPQEPCPPAKTELKGTSNDSSSPDLSNSDEINNDMQSVPQEPCRPGETELRGTSNDTSSPDEIKNNNVQSAPQEPSPPVETELKGTSNDPSSPDLSNSDETNNDMQSMPQVPFPPAESELKGTSNDTSSPDEIKSNNVQSEPLLPSPPAETELKGTRNDTSSHEVHNDMQSVPQQPFPTTDKQPKGTSEDVTPNCSSDCATEFEPKGTNDDKPHTSSPDSSNGAEETTNDTPPQLRHTTESELREPFDEASHTHWLQDLALAVKNRDPELSNKAALFTLSLSFDIVSRTLKDRPDVIFKWVRYREHWLDVLKVAYESPPIVPHGGGISECENWVKFHREVLVNVGARIDKLQDFDNIVEKEMKLYLGECIHCKKRGETWKDRIMSQIANVPIFNVE